LPIAWLYLQSARIRHTVQADLVPIDTAATFAPSDVALAYARLKLTSLRMWEASPEQQSSFRAALRQQRESLLKRADLPLSVVASCAFDGIPGITDTRKILEAFRPSKDDEASYWLLMARAYVNGASFLDATGHTIAPPKDPHMQAMLPQPKAARTCLDKGQAVGAPKGLVKFYSARLYLLEGSPKTAHAEFLQALSDTMLPDMIRDAITNYFKTNSSSALNSRILE
jgi:hypothetical protein